MIDLAAKSVHPNTFFTPVNVASGPGSPMRDLAASGPQIPWDASEVIPPFFPRHSQMWRQSSTIATPFEASKRFTFPKNKPYDSFPMIE